MAEKKSPLQIAMEKDCIFLVVADIISQTLRQKEYGAAVKCRGDKCAEFDWFNSRCGFSK